MSAPSSATVDPLSTLLCGEPIHGKVNPEAERESRAHCSKPKALKLRSDGTPYTVHASRTVLRGGNQAKEEVLAKEKKIIRKYEELPMDLKATARKRRGHEGKPVMELKMPALDTAACPTPSPTDGKITLPTQKKVAFDLPTRSSSRSSTAAPTTRFGTPIHEAEMVKKARSTSDRTVPGCKTQRPAIKIFSCKVHFVDMLPALSKTPAVTPKAAESTIRSRQMSMRAIYDRDPRPLILPQDCEGPRADVKIMEMPVDVLNDKGRVTCEKGGQAGEEWVDVGKENEEEWQIV